MAPEHNPADDTLPMSMTEAEWEESVVIECKEKLEPLLQLYGSKILMKGLAAVFYDVAESASCYPFIARILDNLAEWEP